MATTSTSLSRPAIAAIGLWAVLSGCAAAGATSCPENHAGFRLKTVMVFDGPPSEHADLMPDSYHENKGVGRSEWDVAYIFQAGRHLFVKCDYGPSVPAVILEPEPSTQQCVFLSKRDGAVSLTCGSR